MGIITHKVYPAIGIVFLLLALGVSAADAQQLSIRERDHSKERENTLPDKPEAASEKTHATHRFLDTWGKVANGANLGLATLDAVGTCRTLASGGHEDWLPTQHCGSATLIIVAGVAADISLSYVFHRTGHHKLERIMETVGPADSAAGIATTVANGGKW